MRNENIIQTPYGIYYGVAAAEYGAGGILRDIRLNEKNVLITHIGELVPAYGEETHRRKYKPSITFHSDGMVKTVSLEEQQDVMTPIGQMPAELVSFYETGELKRVFPLDGKISGYWTEEEESALNIPLSFEFEFTAFTAKLSSICFYKNGSIKSITLTSNERIMIDAPGIGPISVRAGFSLYEDGSLHSLEPDMPQAVKTPIGNITAYDIDANGINADRNSVCFDENGNVSSILTSSDRITVMNHSRETLFFAPGENITVPLRIDFDYQEDIAAITDAEGTTLKLSFDDSFHIRNGTGRMGCTALDCASCSLCSQ